MDFREFSNYFSFTLTVPPTKQVYYSGRRRKFGSLSQHHQYTFLKNHICKVLYASHYDEFDFVFEEHKNLCLHVHGFAVVNPEYMHYAVMERFIDDFYQQGQVIGIKPRVYKQISDYQQCLTNPKYWEDYISKHQDNIKFFSPLRQQEKELKDLEHGICKIQPRPPTPPTPPEGYYDEYRFKGKNEENNIFFVEL